MTEQAYSYPTRVLAELPQHLQAHARANYVRTGRAQIKREVKAGRPIAPLILDPPDVLATMTLYNLLRCQERWGVHRSRKFIHALDISEARTLERLTERQRRVVVEALGGMAS